MLGWFTSPPYAFVEVLRSSPAAGGKPGESLWQPKAWHVVRKMGATWVLNFTTGKVVLEVVLVVVVTSQWQPTHPVRHSAPPAEPSQISPHGSSSWPLPHSSSQPDGLVEDELELVDVLLDELEVREEEVVLVLVVSNDEVLEPISLLLVLDVVVVVLVELVVVVVGRTGGTHRHATQARPT